jgi:hypothetical protein
MFRIKHYIEKLGLAPRREYRRMIIVNTIVIMIAVASFLVMSIQVGFVVLIGGLFGVNLYQSLMYQQALERRENERISAFISAFTIIKIFVNNHFNVYRALEETIKYVKPIIREDLIRLLEDIDVDKSIHPYVRFARGFSPLIIEQLLIGLYQLDTEGGQVTSLANFDYMFDQFQHQKTIDQRRRYEERLDAMNMWPLIGAGIIALNLLFGVVGIIIGAINEL